jgi:hypothetical protein
MRRNCLSRKIIRMSSLSVSVLFSPGWQSRCREPPSSVQLSVRVLPECVTIKDLEGYLSSELGTEILSISVGGFPVAENTRLVTIREVVDEAALHVVALSKCQYLAVHACFAYSMHDPSCVPQGSQEKVRKVPWTSL